MNKEELKNCFDAITPTDEQEEKMLAEILKHKKTAFKPNAIYKYGAAFAAMIAIGVSLSSWPQLQNIEYEKADKVYSYRSKEKSPEETENLGVLDQPSGESVQKVADKNVENTKNVVDKAPENLGEKASENRSNEALTREKEETVISNNQIESSDSVVFRESEPSVNEASGSHLDAMEDDNNDMIMMAVPEFQEDYSGKFDALASGYRELTYSEIMQDDIYGKLFPKSFLEGFEFVGAKSFDSSLDADFKSESGEMYIRIYHKDNADSSLVTITPDELLKYKQVNDMSFSVLCDEYIVVYEIYGKNISGIYEMVVSTNYFTK